MENNDNQGDISCDEIGIENEWFGVKK